MKIRQTGLVLTLALTLAIGCRSPRRTHHPQHAPRIDTVSQPQSAEISLAEQRGAAPAATADELDSATSNILQVAAAELEDPTKFSPDSVASTRLTIHHAIELGLVQNPDLIALRQAEGVGATTLGVAKTYPFNPWVQVQTTPYQKAPSGGPGTTTHYVLLMQQLQLANQQQYREEAASAGLNSIRWNVLQAELLNVAQTERLYFITVYQRGLRDLARVNAENNRQLLAILQSQLEAGQATAADVAIVRLDVRSTRQQQKIAEANLQTAMLDLKRHLGWQPDTTMDLDEDVLRWTWRPAESSRMVELASSRPDVMASRADADTARANTSLANAARTPDLQLGPIYLRDDFGVTFLGFRAQMDLPVVNNGIPLLRQREAELCQRTMTSQQLATRAKLEAEAAANRYKRARGLLDESSSPIQTSLPVELQRLEEQFKAGEVDILRVLQARNSLLQNQRADLDALQELMLAAVAVTATTGSPLETLVVPAVLQP